MLLTNEKLNFNVSIENCFANLKPHPKFAKCNFENYIPDEKYPSQSEIKEILKTKLEELHNFKIINKPQKFTFFKKKSFDETKPKNIYIDGGYGVGKTHLLSAFYNGANCSKAFMSFSELNYFFNFLGINECIEKFSKLKLLLIDEFELDDPATTRLIAKFFQEINKKTLIITTSNTLPSDLGKMKFQVEEFEREMGIIANTFTTVIVEGQDYRKRIKKVIQNHNTNNFFEFYEKFKPEKNKALFTYDYLMQNLINNHPFKYFVIPNKYDAIFIDDLNPFPLLNNALRFTHLIDHCYYYNTKIFIRSNYQIKDLFSEEMLESCFQKKLLRCMSRLGELSVFFKD
jgi:cell division protein ZapE